MSDWCKGFLKIRGAKEDIKNFCLNGLEVPKHKIFKKRIEDIIKFISIKFTNDSCSEYINVLEKCHIKETLSGFINQCESFFYEDDLPTIIRLNAAFEWNVDEEELLKIAKKYNLDLRFHGFQETEQFEVILEISNGYILEYKTIDYTTQNDWQWKCIKANF